MVFFFLKKSRFLLISSLVSTQYSVKLQIFYKKIIKQNKNLIRKKFKKSYKLIKILKTALTGQSDNSA